MKNEYIVREIFPVDYSVLEDFLYHAIFVPTGTAPPSREVIFQPELYIYIKDFGGKNDCGVVAEQNNIIIGAAWSRIIPAFGHIDDDTPELAISVLPEYRGRGIGTVMMAHLFDLLRKQGYERTSLSVQKENSAVRFYQRLGYEIINDGTDRTAHEDYLMIKNLQEYNLKAFLCETPHINFSAPNIQAKAAELFDGIESDMEKIQIAYAFVRDEIPHTFDICATTITAKASDVLEHKTGICHAKSVLLAALLRSQGIPAGFRFQRLTLMDDDSEGYCVHCYNAVFLNRHWIELDARGNKEGVNAQFSLEEPILAFPCRPQYNEYHWPGIYANPHAETMAMLEQADSLDYVIQNIPDEVLLMPDVQ